MGRLEQLFLIIKNKIWPYFMIGVLFPLFVKIHKFIISNNFMQKYFAFVGIKPNLLKDYNNIFKEHLAEYTLIYGFIMLLIFSSLMRIIFGQIDEKDRIYQYTISPLRNFLLDLSVVLIGLLSGLGLITLFYDYKRSILFFISLLIPFCFCFLILELSSIPIIPPSDKGIFKKIKNPSIRSRVEGISLLILAFMIFTFHKYFFHPLKYMEKLLK